MPNRETEPGESTSTARVKALTPGTKGTDRKRTCALGAIRGAIAEAPDRKFLLSQARSLLGYAKYDIFRLEPR